MALKDKDVLKFNPKGGGADFVMHEDARIAWVTVGGVSVCIHQTGGKCIVELFPTQHEGCCNAAAECEAVLNLGPLMDKDHRS